MRTNKGFLTVIGLALIVGSLWVWAATCRDIQSVNESAVISKNTGMGGHLTQHILGETPPNGKSQDGKTLFANPKNWNDAWRQYKYISNPVNCGSGGQAQQTVSLEKLGIKYMDALSCKAANQQGECTKYDTYMAEAVFYGFIFKDGNWIINTAFPVPMTD